jgi:hypothetical protein
VNRTSLVITLAALAASCVRPAPLESARQFCLEMFGALEGRRASCESWSAEYQALTAAGTAAGCEFLAQTVTDGRERLDPVRSRECLRDLKAALAAAACSAEEPRVPSACDEALRPAVAQGGACIASGDCIDGYCPFPTGVCAGQSLASCAPLIAEGEPCNSIWLWPAPLGPCQAGLECRYDFTSGTGACLALRPLVAVGEPCSFEAWCPAGAYCSFPNSDTGPGSCMPRLALGMPCGWDGECSAGLVCGAQGACAQYVGTGASCAAATTACGPGNFCDGQFCLPLPDLGASCAASLACLRGYCASTDKVCRPLKTGGEPCADFRECVSDCVDGVCAASLCQP